MVAPMRVNYHTIKSPIWYHRYKQIAYLLQAIFLELQFKVHEITDCAKNVYLQRMLRKTLLTNTQHLLAERKRL